MPRASGYLRDPLGVLSVWTCLQAAIDTPPGPVGSHSFSTPSARFFLRIAGSQHRDEELDLDALKLGDVPLTRDAVEALERQRE